MSVRGGVLRATGGRGRRPSWQAMLRVTVMVLLVVACAGRSKPAEVPVAAAPAPDGGAVADGAADGSAEPSYGEVMRGEGFMTGGLARAELRRWLAPLHALDTSTCEARGPRYYACWCRLACGVRFETRAATVRVSWPFTGASGPGLEVAPDGRVRECFYSSASERIPYTALACPASR